MSAAQDVPRYSENAVKAVFLYRFVSYVNWPADAPALTDFTIAIVHADGVADELESLLSGRPANGRELRVRRITYLEEMDDPRILYLGPESLAQLPAIKARIGVRPVLIVTDSDQGLQYGGMINFRLVDHRVRFEVSQMAAERVRLSFSSDLLSVASRVLRGDSAPNDSAGEEASAPSVTSRR
jgi:hypothetical protein